MKEILQTLLKLSEKKYRLNQATPDVLGYSGETRKEWNSHERYLKGIQEELVEVQKEIIPHNSIYLEDELGDVLWDYINLLYTLEKEDYISLKDVFNRCEKKYSQRVEGIENAETWADIKARQKIELQKQHNLRYGK